MHEIVATIDRSLAAPRSGRKHPLFSLKCEQFGLSVERHRSPEPEMCHQLGQMGYGDRHLVIVEQDGVVSQRMLIGKVSDTLWTESDTSGRGFVATSRAARDAWLAKMRAEAA